MLKNLMVALTGTGRRRCHQVRLPRLRRAVRSRDCVMSQPHLSPVRSVTPSTAPAGFVCPILTDSPFIVRHDAQVLLSAKRGNYAFSGSKLVLKVQVGQASNPYTACRHRSDTGRAQTEGEACINVHFSFIIIWLPHAHKKAQATT